MSILNYIKVCEKNVPGNMYVFLLEKDYVEAVTIVAGEVTDIIATFPFKQIQADPDSIIRLCQQILNDPNKTVYNHSVSMGFSLASLTLNDLANQLGDASACGIIAIVMDSNGQGWLVGWNADNLGERPLYLQDDNFTSGKELTEVEGGKRVMTLFTNSAYIDLPMNSTINAYILDSIAAGTDLGFTP